MNDFFHNWSLWSEESSFSWIIPGKKSMPIDVDSASKATKKRYSSCCSFSAAKRNAMGSWKSPGRVRSFKLKLMCRRMIWEDGSTHEHHETVSQIENGNRNFLILDNQHGSSTSGGSSVSGVANGILLWLVSGLLPSRVLRGHAGTLGKWNPCCGSIGWPIANLTLAWRSGARKPKVSHRFPYCLMAIWRIKLVKPPFSDSPTCFCSWNFQHPPSSQFDRKILLANGLDHKIFLASPQGALPKTMAGGYIGRSMYQ